jgi:hypothetical protein
MDEEVKAKELTRLNASAKGHRSQFVLIRNVLVQALPLYDDGATQSRRRMIDKALEKIGPAADRVHEAYQQLIELDKDERHHDNVFEPQHITGKKHNKIIAHADEVLSKEEGPRQQQQQQPPRQVQGDIIAATVAAMQAANGNQGTKKIDYHLKPKILGKEFTTSELRTWCNGMVFFWAAQLMETREEQVRWANFYDCIHGSLKSYYEPKMPRGRPQDSSGDHTEGPPNKMAHPQQTMNLSSKSKRRTSPSTSGTSTSTASARTLM